MKMDLKSEDDDGDVPVELCIKWCHHFICLHKASI